MLTPCKKAARRNFRGKCALREVIFDFVGIAQMKLSTKFEISSFTGLEDMFLGKPIFKSHVTQATPTFGKIACRFCGNFKFAQMKL